MHKYLFSPQNLFFQTLSSIVIELGRGPWLGHEAEASWIRLMSLQKGPQRPLLPFLFFFYVSIQQEVHSLQCGRLSPEDNHAGTLILGVKPLELWEKNFCCL